MTLTQLIAKVRSYLQDNGASPRWSDAEITDYLNEALDTFCLETGATQTSAALAVAADTPTYAFWTLPADILSLTRVEGPDGELAPASLSVFDCIDNWEADTGTPCRVLHGPYGQRTIRVWPYENCAIKAWYVRQPVQLVDPTDEPEILTAYHKYLPHGATELAYAAKGSPSRDESKAAYHASKFAQGIAFAISNAPSQPSTVPYRHL